MWLPLLLLQILCTTTAVRSAPPPAGLLAGIIPKCYATRPHCIRPRAEECRDAITLIGMADPGYPVLVGRSEVIKGAPRTYKVPYMWSSLPVNCIVRIDVTDPKATEEVTLIALAAIAEVVVRKCVVGGTTGCGGSVLVGRAGKLKLEVAYYTAIEPDGGVLAWHLNRTRLVGGDF